MKKIGIFGGSFNPIHCAHLILAERVWEEAHLDAVLFVPARRPPHKPNQKLLGSEHRLEMVRRAIGDNSHFDCSTIELQQEGPSYTLRTVRKLHERMSGEVELFLIMGSDSVLDLPNWWNAQELVEEIQIIAVNRPDNPVDDLTVVKEAFGSDVVRSIKTNWVEMPLLEISATEIRNRIKEGKSIRYLVPDSVRSYIAEYGLYSDIRDGNSR